MKNLPIEALIVAQGNELKTDSRKVAAAFGRQHKNVLRSIDEFLQKKPEFASAHFWAYVEKQQVGSAEREMRGYMMDKDGFMLLTMGFNGDRAFNIKIAYIEAFNEMRHKLDNINTSLISKLLAALEAEKQSAALASMAGRILRERRDEKPANQMRIEHYEQQIQPLLVGFEAA